jgi:Protein of unknown function (DUF3604)
MNISTTYPPPFVAKILSIEGMGGQAVNLYLTIPAVIRPKEEFALKIAVVDENGMLAGNGIESLSIAFPDAGLEAFELEFPAEQVPVAELGNFKLDNEGFFRCSATLNGQSFYSNPTRCVADPSHPRLYWGDPHIHTVLSACNAIRCRSLNFGFTAARYLSALDWCTTADHVSNGRCDIGRWKDQCAGFELYNDSPDFVTLPGYEASFNGGKGGDNNFYLSKPIFMYVDDYETGSVKTVCEKLHEFAETDKKQHESDKTGNFEFFAIPHHTSRRGKHGEIPDEIYVEADMPVVEIHSKWGTSEYRGNPDPLHNIHPGPAYVNDLLQRGQRYGFVGGTDTHCTLTFGYGKEFEAKTLDRLAGLTAVWSDELSRDKVFAGIKGRDCYAASGERIYLRVSCGDLKPGELAAASGPRKFSISAAASGDIETVDIVRNGTTIKTFEPDSWNGEFVWEDDADMEPLWLESANLGEFIYYYIRVRCANRACAWSSPIWLTR